MSNPYARLLGLLPKRPRMIGTVDSISGGVATITLLDGGKVQARGSATVGARVYVRDGLIEGSAPVLPVVSNEI